MLANVMAALSILAAAPVRALVIDDGVACRHRPHRPSPRGTLRATTWPTVNPNGPWSLWPGVRQRRVQLPSWNAGTDSYGVAVPGEVFVFKNTTGESAFGIGPGKVSLQGDWGNAAARWIAPSFGAYKFLPIAVGGSTASTGGGFGNNFAQYAALTMTAPVGRPIRLPTMSGSGTSRSAGNGFAVVASVLNPGFAGGGNAQTDITVSAVPEPASALLLGLGFGC